MDKYLSSFCNFLLNNTQNELAGIIIYGSYVRGYFDANKSDYDVFVLFKDKVIDIQKEIKVRFPRISLQLFMNLKDFKDKILQGGWNTYITFLYTGKILYSTTELEVLQKEILKIKFDFKNFNSDQIAMSLDKLRADTQAGQERNGFNLNKFFYSSLLRKLQILYYIRSDKIELDFNKLLVALSDKHIVSNLKWLNLIEQQVFKRNSKLVAPKSRYLLVLKTTDDVIEDEFKDN